MDATDQVARVLGACVVLFGVAGFGLVRFLLPEGLRRHELLWILPVGAVAVAFAMTPLGFLGIPYRYNLALVIAGGVALSALALRRRGLPARPELRAIGWPAYLGLLLIAVALIPLFRSGFATVIGEGSDAHMAAGTAEFLRHAPPRGIEPSLPVDEVWPTWRSKQAIYYAFAAVASVSGMETWQVLSTLGAFLLALGGIGLYVLAREMLGAPVGGAAFALVIVGLNRMVLHTGMHPYFNQTWGYFALAFALVLAWWVVDHPSRGAAALLALFLVVCGFAYPLAVPIPLFVLGVMLLVRRRERRRRGEHVPGRREAWAAFKGLPRRFRWPAYVVVLLLLTPLWGVYEKFEGAMQLLLSPRYSLELWGGDLDGWFPEQRFFTIHPDEAWWASLAVIAAFALWELRRLPRAVAAGLLAFIAVGVGIAIQMRFRDYGWYFHFKILAFLGPLVVLLAAVAMWRLRDSRRRWVRYTGTALVVVWAMWATAEAREETSSTFDELPRTYLQLQEFSDALPPGSSIRLDMQPGAQLWAAYMLHEHPLCSQRPLSQTAYPHPPLSRAADFVVVRHLRRPFDAVGAPIMANKEFRVYRLAPGLPGGDRCSQRMIQTVGAIQRG